MSAFGVGGIKALPSPNDVIKVIALDPCGNVVVAGTNGGSVMVQKLDPNGNPMLNFGTDGKASPRFLADRFEWANGIAIDAQGSVYVAASSGYGLSGGHQPSGSSAWIAKLNANGTLVPEFGTGGKVSLPTAVAGALTIDANANLYIAGGPLGVPRVVPTSGVTIIAYDAPPDVFVLDSNGSPVTSFCNGGHCVLPKPDSHALQVVNGIKLDASGRLLLVGNNSDAEFTVVRLLGVQTLLAPIPPAPVYSFFNTSVGAHFYTASSIERDNVIASLPQFRYEGPRYSAFSEPAARTSPVYRFFDTMNGFHFYTISESEKSDIVCFLPRMRLEGTAYHAYPEPASGTSAVYRFVNTRNGAHFFTSSIAERDEVLNLYPWFRYEGAAFYALP